MNSNRIAVLVCFFINGFLHANLMARLPELQKKLEISNSILGSLLFSMSVGAMISMPIIGWLSAKYGSKITTQISSVLFCICLATIPLSESIWIVAFCFFITGIGTGAMDVSMNGQAVLVERAHKKPIMSSFHACFSIGMAVGAGFGAGFSKFQISLPIHIILLSILCLFGLILSSKNLIKHESTSIEKNVKWQLLKTIKIVLPFGIVAFCCMISEGSMVDWTAIFMNKVQGQSLTISAFAFGTFAAGMTIGRLFGDSLVLKFGNIQMLKSDAILSIFGMSLVLFFINPISAFIGLFLVGLGVSTIVPIIFSAAGNTPGVEPSVGISAASSIGYLGFFVGPPSIGFLGDAFGLRIGLGFSLLLLIIMFLLIQTQFKKGS